MNFDGYLKDRMVITRVDIEGVDVSLTITAALKSLTDINDDKKKGGKSKAQQPRLYFSSTSRCLFDFLD